MDDFFCGWYYKCQSGDETLAVIPALHRSGGAASYSIQLLTGDGQWNVPFSEGFVETRGSRPQAHIGGCRFLPGGMALDLYTEGLSAEGAVHFHHFSPLRSDIMGPFRFVPGMECRHTVFSLRHRVDGELTVNGRCYRFDDGDGYLEGDRGRSFPRRYAWTQCCFPEGSLMLSVADVPLGPLTFTGAIAAVLWQGTEYRLATYLGAAVRRVREGEIVLRQGEWTLTARLLEQGGRPLRAPVGGAMARTIHEHAACRAFYRLDRGGRPLFAFESPRASFEFEYP